MAAGSPFLANAALREWSGFVPIAASDTVNQAPFSGLVCSTGGTVSLVDALGNVASLTLSASVIYRLPMCVRVNATGTTAVGLVGLA